MGALLAGAVEQLRRSDTGRLDAEVLLAYVTGRSRASLAVEQSADLPENQVGRFRSLVGRRAQGEPVAYLTGHKEFWSLELKVNASVLIPRPETELLVERVLSLSKERKVSTLLDLGTGSGAIALAVASELPDCMVTATDHSLQAIELAQCNAKSLSITNVGFRPGSWFQPVCGERFDVIISNPPYVAEGDPHLRQGDVRFEPAEALVSGIDGLDDIQEIIGAAAIHLNSSGRLMLEHGFDQGNAVRVQFENAGYRFVETALDLAGLERMTWGQLSVQ